MNAHGIEVFDAADDDHVVVTVAHDLHFHFFPAENALFEHDFGSRTRGQAAPGDFEEVVIVVGHAAARSAQGEGRAHDERQWQFFCEAAHIVHAAGYAALGNFEADVFHGRAEMLTAFRFFNDFGVGADEFHAVLFQRAVFPEGEGGVQCRLSAERGENGVRPLPGDNRSERSRFDGFHIGGIRHVGVGHDGGGVGVNQNDGIAFLFQGLDSLGAGIIEFTALAYDNRPCADDKDFMQVCTFGHDKSF